MWHKLAHLTGWNMGVVVTWFKEGDLMVGFMCDTCGRIEGIHKPHKRGRVSCGN